MNIKKGVLNFSINHEKHISNYLKRLEKSGSLSTKQYKKNNAVEIRPETFYGLHKTHKAITDFCPPFSPILTPSDKLTKF